jgi:neutral ceramidase
VTNAKGRANSGDIPNDTAFGAETFQVLGSRLDSGRAEGSIVNGLLALVRTTGNRVVAPGASGGRRRSGLHL